MNFGLREVKLMIKEHIKVTLSVYVCITQKGFSNLQPRSM